MKSTESSTELEFIPGTLISREYLDWIQWVHDETWQYMLEVCRIPKELLYDGQAKKDS